MSWEYGDRRAVSFTVEGELTVAHDCPVFGVAVVSSMPFRDPPTGHVVPLCGCYPDEIHAKEEGE